MNAPPWPRFRLVVAGRFFVSNISRGHAVSRRPLDGLQKGSLHHGCSCSGAGTYWPCLTHFDSFVSDNLLCSICRPLCSNYKVEVVSDICVSPNPRPRPQVRVVPISIIGTSLFQPPGSFVPIASPRGVRIVVHPVLDAPANKQVCAG